MADKRKLDELLSPASRELESARLDVMQLKRQAKLRALELLADASGTKPAAASSSSAGTGSEATAAQREGPPDEDDAVWNEDGDDEFDASAPRRADLSIVLANGRGDAGTRQSGRGLNSVDSTVEPDERADALEAYMNAISAQADAERRPAREGNSRCVLLVGVLSAANASDVQEVHTTRMETGYECSRWGNLLRVHAVGTVDPDGAPTPAEQVGRIFVEFEDAEAAAECARSMDGRFFDGRRVTASFYPLDAFLAGDLGHEGAVVQQTAITWEDIVAMNSRPASSWDTMANAALPASGLGSSSAAAMEVDDATPATNVEGASAVELPPPAASTAAASSSATAETETSAAAAGIPATAAVAAVPEALEEPSNFHAEFMRAMRAQAAEAARQAAHASQELLEGRDDAMDALVEEFPEAAEHVEAPEGEDEEEDEEDRALAARAKKKELPKIDHSTVEYAPFRKNFYVEVPEISNMSEEQVEELRKSLDSIKVRGKRCPRPIKRWTQCGLSDRLLGAIAKAGYGKPFPIQAQSLPAIMSGRDVIGIAKTGSGKTMGYALPLLRHVMDQPALAPGDGPIGLVMVPTRELAMQVYREVAKFAKVVGLATAAVYGGADLKAQIAELKRGAEIVVCTPGRMIDMLTANSGRVTNLRRATYVVLDEADRMFDMGFAPQIDRIVGNTRPDRQTLLFSATFPQAVEKLARSVLTKPVQIIVGGISVVSNMIEQHVEVLSAEQKLPRLCHLLRQHYDEGQQLVFVDTQEASDNLFRQLLKQNLPCATLHGGMGQDDRDSTIANFKNGDISVLVATSVAARGLDVKGLAVVINYEVPNHYEDYVHRVGRTGRAGNTGIAYTFLAPDEEKFAPDLVKAMEAAGQEPPDELLCMANSYQAKRRNGELSTKDYRTSGFKSGKGISLDAESLAKEEKHKREARRAAQRAAGVELDDADDDDDDDAVVVSQGRGAAGSSGQLDMMDTGASVAAAAAQAAKTLQKQLGNVQGGNAIAAEVKKRMLEASKAAKEVSALAAANGGGMGLAQSTVAVAEGSAGASSTSSTSSIGGAAGAAASVNPLAFAAAAGAAALNLPAPSPVVDAATQLQNARMASLPPAVRKALEAAQEKAAEVARKQRAEAEAQAAAAREALLKAQPVRTERYKSELEINDYPQMARQKVMAREVILGISELTKAAITAKGSYFPPGRNPPAGERKLYFLIESDSDANVRAARKELKRSLDEHAALGAPAEADRYAKYKI